MKVLLINPPWIRFFGSSSFRPPMGILHLAAYIKQELPNVGIDIYDADLETGLVEYYSPKMCLSHHERYLSRIKSQDDPVWGEAEEVIRKFAPDIVGISTMTATYMSSMQLSHIIKAINKNIKVVFGGKHATALPEYILSSKTVDFVVFGEGELTFKELLLDFKHPREILGLAYKGEDGKIYRNKLRPYIKDLSNLPLPIFFSSISKYDFESNVDNEDFVWDMIGARGCPFNCIYCSSEKIVRTRSIEHISEEILFLKRNYGIKKIRFQDDSFSFSLKRIKEICEGLKKLNIEWECNTRVDMLSEEIAGLMKDSGCRKVSIGIESASQSTINKINKQTNIEKIKEAIALLKSQKIKVFGYFIIGFPWETKKDMLETYWFAKKLHLDGFEINIATPLPGTELFNGLLEKGKIELENIDWYKFHQNSDEMNFSEMSDADWMDIINNIQKKLIKFYRMEILKTRLSYLTSPKILFKKIKNKYLNAKKYKGVFKCRHR